MSDATQTGLQPGDSIQIQATTADGPTTLNGTVEFFDNQLAADSAAAAGGDREAALRVLRRMDEHQPGLSDFLLSQQADEEPPSSGSGTSVHLALSPGYARGYDAIFGKKDDKEKKND